MGIRQFVEISRQGRGVSSIDEVAQFFRHRVDRQSCLKAHREMPAAGLGRRHRPDEIGARLEHLAVLRLHTVVRSPARYHLPLP
jgi:hypothetical protein